MIGGGGCGVGRSRMSSAENGRRSETLKMGCVLPKEAGNYTCYFDVFEWLGGRPGLPHFSSHLVHIYTFATSHTLFCRPAWFILNTTVKTRPRRRCVIAMVEMADSATSQSLHYREVENNDNDHK